MNGRSIVLRGARNSAAAISVIALIPFANAQTTAGSPVTVAVTTTPTASTSPTGNVLRPVGVQLEASGGALNGSAGRIRTFAGNIWGSAGRIRTFSGDLSGKAGRIRTFSETAGSVLDIKEVKANQNVKTFFDNIKALQSQTIGNTGFWGTAPTAQGVTLISKANVDAFEANYKTNADALTGQFVSMRDSAALLKTYEQNTVGYGKMLTSLQKIVADSKAKWGATITSQTGKSFEEAIATRLLAKYQINLSDARSLEGMDESAYLLFLLDWRDNMYAYSGRDNVDSWMRQVNWSPFLSQQANGLQKAKIGLLDFSVTGAESASIVSANGISTVAGGHGDAVASLLVAGHNGRGSLGLAPNASLIAFNPFDSTNTAGWADAKLGIDTFTAAGATIVNVSLGVPGWTFNDGWNALFSDGTAKSQLYVFAAGNDGISQSTDVEWAFNLNPALLIVGSVDPTNNISAFSNQPGNACLLTAGVCQSNNDRLMNRFIVAPGEFMLVSDGLGGVTRVSGTSFAAPLVTGTATLIEQHWPWLASRPNIVADIILKSAKDLGAPGVDAVFGHGMLDVTAALSPLNFSELTYKAYVNGAITSIPVSTIRSVVTANTTTWESSGAYLTMFEQLDPLDAGAQRDFAVPMSTKLVGKSVGSSGLLFQSYVTSRFLAWTKTRPYAAAFASKSFADNNATSPMSAFGGVTLAMRYKERENRASLRGTGAPFESALLLTSNDGKFGFQLGSGNGAVALAEQNGFGLSSDYDVSSGGANPFLAMASGSGYASASVAVNEKLNISTGTTSQVDKRDLADHSPADRPVLSRLKPYGATASYVSASFKATNWLTTNVSYTMLHERRSLIGVRSLDPTDFADGSTTDAVTYGLDVAATPSLGLTASGTIGRTRAANLNKQNIGVSGSGLLSSAFQIGVTKTRLFGRHDSARLTLAQPMHLERGTIDYNGVEVVNRETGELGLVKQTIGLQTQKRNFVAEAIYRHPLIGGQAEFNLSGRARFNQDEQFTRDADLIFGAGFRLAF